MAERHGEDDEFTDLVADALAHLGDAAHLQTHPLVRHARRRRPAEPRWRALQHDLVEAIEALDPGRDSPPTQRESLLRLHYLQGLEPRMISRRLGIGHGEYYRRRERALAALASLLRERWALPVAAIPTTSFLARERELAEVARALERTRLLTLTGPAGVGKTRLAREVAAALDGAPEHPDGAWFVDLARVVEEDGVAPAVLAAVGGKQRPGQPAIGELIEQLHGRNLLLLLDNCEHVLAACTELVARLLEHCRGVRVLATSRAPLAAPGEALYPVPPLAAPDPSARLALAELAACPAVRLFMDRARAVAPALALTEENAHAVATICHQLDGLPLALELAAARTRMLAPAQIAAQLADQARAFRLLEREAADGSPRHRGLAPAIDWSHDLLSEPERRLFRWLAVFARGWTLEAAEAVCAGEGLPAEEMLDRLASLVDKSLVLVDSGGAEARYRFLEPVRQYAERRLIAAGEAEPARRRHRDWIVALVERAGPGLEGPEQEIWLDRLEREHDNLRAALACCRDDGREGPVLGLRIASYLAEWFWAYGGHHAEGIAWLELFLAATVTRNDARARALMGLGLLWRYANEHERASRADAASLAIAREIGDGTAAARALAHLGMTAATLGDCATGRAQLEESLALTRSRGDELAVAHRTRDLALVCMTAGDLPPARALLEESLGLARRIGARGALGAALQRLAVLHRLTGDLARSHACVEESMVVLKAARHLGAVEQAWSALANLARVEGRFDEASRILRDGLLRLRGRPFHHSASAQLGLIGILEIARGRVERGVRLIGAHAATAGAVGTVHDPDVRIEGEAALARARALLGEDAHAAAWTAGLSMTLPEAVDDALEELGPTAADRAREEAPPPLP